MINFNVRTNDKNEVVDITSKINQLISNENINEGTIEIFVLHTTCALTTADLDPGTDQDYITAINKMFPQGNYNHPHDPSHVGDHIMSSIIGNSVSLPINKGGLVLGTWQSVVLIEMNGPKKRQLVAVINRD